MLYKKYSIAVIFILLLFVSSYGQVVILNPYDGTTASYVNNQIVADTTANGGLPANRVYELKRGQLYLANAIFNVPNAKTLRLRAEEGTGAKPVIYLYETGTGQTPTRPPGNFVVLNGGSLEMSNICVAGFYEGEPSRLGGVQGGLINVTAVGSSITLDGVVLSNINGQHVRVGFNSPKVKITNSIFANMGALTTSNLGAGKGLDLREIAVDSLILLNNTFVNFQDRAIRHYNVSNPSQGTGVLNYVLIDHNTFINGMGFHGLFSLGNVGEKVMITNNVFMDAFALGEDSSDATRSAEWANTGEFYPSGKNRIMWIFAAPNQITQWTIKNNYYALSDSGKAFLNDFNFKVGSQLSWHINSRLGADSVNAFKQVELALNNTPRLMTNEMRWYESPAGGNKTKNTPTDKFVVARDDMDRRPIEYYMNEFNAGYSVSSTVYTGADGYPAGDLNWFPDKYEQWKNGVPAEAAISLSATEINFGTVDINTTKVDSIQISNTGGGVLNVTQISSSNSTFTFSPATLSIPGLGSAYLKVSFKPTDTNAQTGTITLTDNAAGSPHTFNVIGIGQVGVGVKPDLTNIPKEFALNQNYPNPFNPVTNIIYALPKQSKVTLTVYNALGQEVVKLVDNEQSAGTYTVTWDGKNASGIALSSGIYFYQIRSNDIVITKKMQLLK